jgi:hypothetical protein
MQALDAILADNTGYYHHPYLEEDNDELQTKTCIVCKGEKKYHITGFNDDNE